MSKLTPDLFPVKKFADYYEVRPDSTIKPVVAEEDPKITLDEFKKYLDEYANNYEGEISKFYTYAKITAKSTKNNRANAHYLHLFNTFFIASIKKANPDIDLTELSDSLKNVEKALDKVLRYDNVENVLYIPSLLGMYRGLI